MSSMVEKEPAHSTQGWTSNHNKDVNQTTLHAKFMGPDVQTLSTPLAIINSPTLTPPISPGLTCVHDPLTSSIHSIQASSFSSSRSACNGYVTSG